MIIKPVCPKCLMLAFSYYVGSDIDLEKKGVDFPMPISCNNCGYKISKIKAGEGILVSDSTSTSMSTNSSEGG